MDGAWLAELVGLFGWRWVCWERDAVLTVGGRRCEGLLGGSVLGGFSSNNGFDGFVVSLI